MAPNYTELLKKLSKSQIDPELLERINNLGKNHKDALTGLLDYRSFSWQIEDKLENNCKYTFIALSIDFLQELNLISGWVVGDLALCSMASFLEKLPGNNDIAGRVSGATFMLCLEETKIRKIRQWIDDLSQQLSQLALPGIEMFPEGHLTLSAGVYCNVVQGLSSEKCMTEARNRLEFAQKQGGGKVIVLAENQAIYQEDKRKIETKIKATKSKDWLDTEFIELSMNGLSINCNTPCLVREAISIQLHVEEHPSLNLHGEVVWRRPVEEHNNGFSFYLGVKFQNLEEEQIHQLEHIMTGVTYHD